jgi:tetratricopeptide (TPR) repeat protein
LYPTLAIRAWTLFILLFAAAAQAVQGDFAAPALKNFEQAQARYRQEPQNAEAAWQFARASFDLAEFATNKTERADLAQQGIAASRQALAGDPNSAPAHYYLGMNLGQLARTRGLSALKLVDEMEREFSRSRELDEHLDYGGSDRNLGTLYRDAPSIGSIGDRSKARQHLQRAVTLAPEYPENHLALLEACLKWGDRNCAQRELKALEELWPAARAKFTGPAWGASWADWEPRLQQARSKLEGPSKALESPRQKQ